MSVVRIARARPLTGARPACIGPNARGFEVHNETAARFFVAFSTALPTESVDNLTGTAGGSSCVLRDCGGSAHRPGIRCRPIF